jgi:predicted aspartyl protease
MPMFQRAAFLAGILMLLVGGCVATMPSARSRRSPFQSHVAFDAYPAHVPFRRTPGDLPIVLAETENGSLWMLVDTGCDAVLFAPRIAKRTMMDVKPLDANMYDAVGNATRIDGVAPIDRLSLGPAHFYGFYSIVSDIGNIIDKDHPPGGIAGLPLFGDALLTIDYSRNELVIQPGSLPPPAGKEILPMDLTGGKISVPFSFGDRNVSLVLDTGFSGFVVIPHDQVADFPGAERKLAHSTVRCFYGTDDIDLAQLRDDLHIGQHTIEQPIVAVGNGTKAMIGAQYLKHFIITIDQRNRRIRFATADRRALYLPGYGRETEHEVTMLDRLMQRPTTAASKSPATQPAAIADQADINP